MKPSRRRGGGKWNGESHVKEKEQGEEEEGKKVKSNGWKFRK